MKSFALVGFVLLIAGCYPAKQVTVTAADLRVPERTRMTGMLQSAAGTEVVPQGFSREVVVDEAWISMHDAKRTCLSVTMRTGADLDAPLSEWLVEVNGAEARFVDETSNVKELPYTENETMIAAQRATDRGVASFNMSQPVNKVFRVYERRATACGPSVNDDGNVDLLLRNRVVRGQEWYERFTWNLQ